MTNRVSGPRKPSSGLFAATNTGNVGNHCPAMSLTMTMLRLFRYHTRSDLVHVDRAEMRSYRDCQAMNSLLQ